MALRSEVRPNRHLKRNVAIAVGIVAAVAIVVLTFEYEFVQAGCFGCGGPGSQVIVKYVISCVSSNGNETCSVTLENIGVESVAPSERCNLTWNGTNYTGTYVPTSPIMAGASQNGSCTVSAVAPSGASIVGSLLLMNGVELNFAQTAS